MIARPALRPRTLFLSIAAIVLAAWAGFLIVDVWRIGDLPIALWLHLFNDRPIEWMQWVILSALIISAAYQAGRLRETSYRGAFAFWIILAIGAAAMLIEDAGDVRHILSDYARKANSGERHIFGIHYRIVVEVPYFAAISAIPLYALLRYGRYIWRAPSARVYLIGGYGLYALCAIGNGLRHLSGGSSPDGLYTRMGAVFDRVLAGGNMSVVGMEQSRVHFWIMDSAVEESLELIAATCLLCMALAFARDMAAGRVIADDAATMVRPAAAQTTA